MIKRVWAKMTYHLKVFLKLQRPALELEWQASWSAILLEKVAFYQGLSATERQLFDQRALLFMGTTEIISGDKAAPISEQLLVAASAIIPVWSFPRWHYFNLKAVYILPGAFNDDFQCGQPDSHFAGMVGTGPMAGKMALSRPALVQGFANHRDKNNVGIHEFVHLIDMADGDTDGFPEKFRDYGFSLPWFDLVSKKINEIDKNHSNIDQYGATNPVEFFAVASEYFFERPGLMANKHPELYKALQGFYQQDADSIAQELAPRKKSPCPCGSGKRYKHCCLPED